MPRSAAVLVENNFSNGLITEGSALNFPENACTDMDNCVISVDGSIQRRQGLDYETGYQLKTINRNNAVVGRYLWKNVSGDGDVSIMVLQVGSTLHFYETGGVSLSSGEIVETVTLTPVSGAPSPSTIEAQFSSGNGYLFVTHPYCDPMRISYNTSSQDLTAVDLDIKIRDFEGDTADLSSVTSRPTATLAGLNVNHHYNLLNQGWTTTNLTAWDSAQTTMPSNADVMWRFKDTSNNFDASNAAIARVVAGNTPAPKGHYIMSLVDMDRDTASGLSGTTSTDTEYQRVSTTAFFAGRVFYAGLNDPKTNSNIYFTQIIERDEQYEMAYQVNDPTAEDLFDLLPSDGGVIKIQDAGTIYKLQAVPGGLAVFGANGVWYITGSQGLGFTATDYSVQKISSIQTLSASSFIDAAGTPMWWNAEGIYVLVAEGNLPTVKNISESRIKKFFKDIPFECKKLARGSFHVLDNTVYWIYRSTDFADVTEAYEFDTVLLYDVRANSFYPWSISDSDVKVNGIVVVDSVSGGININQVVVDADDVIDASGNNVVTFAAEGSARAPDVKFITSYEDAGSFEFTFAEENNATYYDWVEYDNDGVNYTSYFINGSKMPGQAMMNHQANWTMVYSRTEDGPVSYYFNGIWDFANTGDNTGRWSSQQLVEHSDTKYNTTVKKLKVRGNGRSLQFKVSSVEGEAFDIIGWANLKMVNQIP